MSPAPRGWVSPGEDPREEAVLTHSPVVELSLNHLCLLASLYWILISSAGCSLLGRRVIWQGKGREAEESAQRDLWASAFLV